MFKKKKKKTYDFYGAADIHSETSKHLWNTYGVTTTGPSSGQHFLLVMSTLLKETELLHAGQSADTYDWRWMVTFHRVIFPCSVLDH